MCIGTGMAGRFPRIGFVDRYSSSLPGRLALATLLGESERFVGLPR
jgi:hypothetical protein